LASFPAFGLTALYHIVNGDNFIYDLDKIQGPVPALTSIPMASSHVHYYNNTIQYNNLYLQSSAHAWAVHFQ
jgi:hypothetical protein